MPVGGLAVADPGGGGNGLERALEEQVLAVGEGTTGSRLVLGCARTLASLAVLASRRRFGSAVGAERHTAPGRDLLPAHETPLDVRLLGGVQDPDVGIKAAGHYRGDIRAEGPEMPGNPVDFIISAALARSWL
jgi:hypothetical protein